jgi:hypothetical protein
MVTLLADKCFPDAKIFVCLLMLISTLDQEMDDMPNWVTGPSYPGKQHMEWRTSD